MIGHAAWSTPSSLFIHPATVHFDFEKALSISQISGGTNWHDERFSRKQPGQGQFAAWRSPLGKLV